MELAILALSGISLLLLCALFFLLLRHRSDGLSEADRDTVARANAQLREELAREFDRSAKTIGELMLQSHATSAKAQGQELQLIKEQIAPPLALNGIFEVIVHLLGGEAVIDLHFGVFAENDVVCRDAALLQLQLHHFENRRLARAPHAGKNFHQWHVNKRRDRVDIIGS